MLRFHAIGDWRREQVHISPAADTRPRIEEIETLIERMWNEARERKAGIQLFDGPMCRLESWRADDHGLDLSLSLTSYKPFFGTNLHNAHLADRFGPGALANPVGVSPALLSSDGFLLLGRRNASVAYYPNRLHPFSGTLEPRDQLDVFDEVLRELKEELALQPQQIRDMRCVGLVEDTSLRQPELIFVGHANLARQALEEQVDRREHGGSWAIPATREALESALADPAEFTPVAVASLLLWGRGELGHDWFRESASRLAPPFTSP